MFGLILSLEQINNYVLINTSYCIVNIWKVSNIAERDKGYLDCPNGRVNAWHITQRQTKKKAAYQSNTSNTQ